LKPRILIVEDLFIEGRSLEVILKKAGYDVCAIASSVRDALVFIERGHVELVLLDIILKGSQTGIDLGHILNKKSIPFIYISGNAGRKILEKVKETKPYGFILKPFREKDILVTLDIAIGLHKDKLQFVSKHSSPISPNENSTMEKTSRFCGESLAMRQLYEQISVAADSSISVLISGESGTGKELVAREIHALSSRKNQPMVVVNCSALPVTLIEAELFGHEKGAFTGATARRIGKFEQASGGTIFLDEIGELPMEVQVKFLRVLQEREIEPIGGRLKKIDVRIIAATNRILEDEVTAGRFRLDLYYRLNVFPITTTPLRAHKSDIPLLVEHFIQRYARESGKTITRASEQVLSQLENYDWPGNIRELENLIHRSILMNPGPLLTQLVYAKPTMATPNGKDKTIAENEREHIIGVLEKCQWKVSGKKGAAAILDIKVSTLNARLKKLGIVKPKK